MMKMFLVLLVVVAQGFVWQPASRSLCLSQRGAEAAVAEPAAVAETPAAAEVATEVATPAPPPPPVEPGPLETKKRKKKGGMALSMMEVGAKYEGTVVGVTAYGAFVDVGAESDGLVHISEMSDKFVEDIGSVVAVGDKVEARVLKVDVAKKQLGLSLKSEGAPVTKRPRGGRPKKAGAAELEKFLKCDPKEFIEGTVVTIKPFGAFVNLGPGIDGLVHISRVSDDRVDNVEDYVTVGQKVQVRVTDVDLEKLTVGLAMNSYREGSEGSGQGFASGGAANDNEMSSRARRAYGAEGDNPGTLP